MGTGKTETLMRKYAYLLAQGVSPWKIMCVTFTNKAAKEMQTRAATILQEDEDLFEGAWINTFHSLSNRILRQDKNCDLIGLKSDYHILDQGD